MYALTLRLEADMASANEKLLAALASQQMGIVTTLDVQAVMKKKLDKEIPGYLILGACAPKIAESLIAIAPDIGTLLPCNVVLREENGGVVISFMDPMSVLALANNPAIDEVARMVEEKIVQVIEHLKAH